VVGVGTARVGVALEGQLGLGILLHEGHDVGDLRLLGGPNVRLVEIEQNIPERRPRGLLACWASGAGGTRGPGQTGRPGGAWRAGRTGEAGGAWRATSSSDTRRAGRAGRTGRTCGAGGTVHLPAVWSSHWFRRASA